MGGTGHAEKLETFAKDALERYGLPGLAVGVKASGGAARAGFGACEAAPAGPGAGRGFCCAAAAGFLDAPDKIPLAPENIFHLGSVSKLFVATAILRMVDKGLLDLDAPLTEAVPWFRMDDSRIGGVTLRWLLSHTAGMPDVTDYGWDVPQVDSGALKRFVMSGELTRAQLLWQPGGGRFMYSNMAYELLGAVIAEISGTDFESHIDTEIFRPLGMGSTTFLTFLRTAAGRAMDPESAGRAEIAKALDLGALRAVGVCTPHHRDEAGQAAREAVFPYNREHGPSSTITSNIMDIMKWGDAHLSGSMLSARLYKEASAPYGLVPNNGEHIGLGWFIRQQGGYTLYGHEGTDDGFRASFWICPQLGAQIIVMSNLSDAPVKKINKEAFSLFFG
ncbi:MAG: beta-lactamase family protein [Clostridiales Family XIII bacterium]|jgi:CubicO group peptidase (beta-lactamase class C family)|nr:beta-lactamase family protein [Clostridiales Family XIII bacterium]